MKIAKLTAALAELFLGLLAAMVTLVLVRALIEDGSLPLGGWLTMAVCGAAVIYLGWRTVRWVDPGVRGYLEAIRGSRLDTDPRGFIALVSGLARDFEDQLQTRNYQTDGSATKLDMLSDYLAANPGVFRETPNHLEGATAYYGEIVRDTLKGEWAIGRPIRFGLRRGVVVQVGRGRYKHNILPGLQVYHAASGMGISLQEILQHELAESDNLDALTAKCGKSKP